MSELPDAASSSAPTSAELPTTPGPPTEARCGGEPTIWMLMDDHTWISIHDFIVDPVALSLLRVLFDAGEKP